ncbi:hypothetical protein BY458DRAFT_435476 [Sporodiniella umbellata]|nr:hypothetical protein BY458DRAFT_435476 [Sporodiniella umbellata]
MSLPDALETIGRYELFSGTLKVSASDSSDAYVLCEVLDNPIYIYGSRHRNRALDGDEVAIRLVGVDHMLDEKQAKLMARQIRRASLGHTLQPFPIEKVYERPKYCGEVVCILERPHHMLFAGTLSLHRPLAPTVEREQKNPKVIWIVPINKRLPLVALPVRHAPENFVKYCDQYKNRVFLGAIRRWPDSSLHPFGTIVKEIGWMGELSVQANALIADHHLKDGEFSELSLKMIKSFSAFPTALEKKDRRDLQLESVRIFTLNESEQISDTAFSITCLDKGTCEVGIHVLDIAHYVRSGTPLDKEAKERGFAAFLVEKTLPMLPLPFVESHGRFVSDQERLAISLFCRFSESGIILHTWIGRTVAKSSGHVNTTSTLKKATSIEKDALNVLSLCRKLNKLRREKKEGFFLTNRSVGFQLGESGYPDALEFLEETETEHLKAELFRIANIEVGQRIASKFPDQTLLYREPPIKPSLLVWL